MAQANSALTGIAGYEPPPPDDAAGEDAATVDAAAWRKVLRLLQRASEATAKQDVPPEQFMRAAWVAYLDAHPGLREKLEAKQLRSELKKLRRRGLVGSA